MSLKQTFFKNLLTAGLFAYLAQAFNYLASIFIFRLITPEEYGVISMIIVFSGFLAIFSDIGFTYAVVRNEFDFNFLRKLSSIACILGFGLSIILILLSKPMAWFFESPKLFLPTICLASTFLLQSISIVPKALLQKKENFKTIGTATVVMQMSNSSTQLVCAYLGFSYWSFICGPITGYLLSGSYLLHRTKLTPKFVGQKEMKTIFRKLKSLLKNLSGFNVVNYWARNIDYLFVGKLYDKAVLGTYKNAYFLLLLPINFITMVLNQVLLPSLQNVLSQRKTIENEYKYTEGAISLLVLPVTILFILFPSPFVSLLWGQSWNEVAEYLPYFGVLCYVQATISPISVAFILLNKEKEMLKIGVIAAILIIIATSIGAFFSVTDLIFFYSSANILVTIPIIIHFGFIQSFGFDRKTTLKFWIPRLTICYFITIGIHFNLEIMTYSFLGILTLVTIWKEFEKIVWVSKIISNPVKGKK